MIPLGAMAVSVVLEFNVAQKRVFYACQGVFFKEKNDHTEITTIANAKQLTGVQSVGVSSSIPSVSLPDLGRFQRKYKFDSARKDFEITIERVISKNDFQDSSIMHTTDQGNTFYRTKSYGTSYSTNHILYEDNLGVQGELNSNNKCLKNYDIVIIYGPDDEDRLDNSNTLTNVVYKNCVITNLSYSFSVDGPATESITLLSRTAAYNMSGTMDEPDNTWETGSAQSGQTIKRSDIDFNKTVVPTEAAGAFQGVSDSDVHAGLQSIDIDIAIDYTELMDVGIWRGTASGDEGKQNLWRFVNLPIDVTCSFTGISRALYPYETIDVNDEKFTNDKQIKIVTDSTYYTGASPTARFNIWDLGSKNYLDNISVSGGDASGGNVELTLSYRNDQSDAVIANSATVQNITYNGPY